MSSVFFAGLLFFRTAMPAAAQTLIAGRAADIYSFSSGQRYSNLQAEWRPDTREAAVPVSPLLLKDLTASRFPGRPALFRWPDTDYSPKNPTRLLNDRQKYFSGAAMLFAERETGYFPENPIYLQQRPEGKYTIRKPILLQDSTTNSRHKNRIWTVAGAHIALWTGSYIALNRAWYAGYPRSSFHFFDDLPEWNQMDKAGHVWTTYQVSRASAEAWKWAGLNHNQAAIWGGVSGIAYQTIIEIHDGFSEEWGFSWSDLAANLAGAGAYVFQERGWGEQRIQVKLSYWPYRYADELAGRRDKLFGRSAMERILKDYNSQTYWISANMASFFPKRNIPSWLNIALGYGAGGMLGGRSNIWTNEQGEVFDYSSIRRERFFYLSPDIDFTRIPSKSKLMRALFFTLNSIKMPAPALVLNSSGRWKFRAIHF